MSKEIHDVLDSTTDEEMAEKLRQLSDRITGVLNGTVDTDIAKRFAGMDKTPEELFITFHGITIADYLDEVRLLVENGMVFSRARSYVIEKHATGRRVGTRWNPEYQAELTGITVDSHRQLVSEARKKINESRGLYYATTSDRPIELIFEKEITAFSDFTEGEFMDEMNPIHHSLQFFIGEYQHNVLVEAETEDAVYKRYDDTKSLPQYVVFFEVYTGNGILDTDEPGSNQGQRLHSVTTEYCLTEQDVIDAVADKLEYQSTNESDVVIDEIELMFSGRNED